MKYALKNYGSGFYFGGFVAGVPSWPTQPSWLTQLCGAMLFDSIEDLLDEAQRITQYIERNRPPLGRPTGSWTIVRVTAPPPKRVVTAELTHPGILSDVQAANWYDGSIENVQITFTPSELVEEVVK